MSFLFQRNFCSCAFSPFSMFQYCGAWSGRFSFEMCSCAVFFPRSFIPGWHDPEKLAFPIHWQKGIVYPGLQIYYPAGVPIKKYLSFNNPYPIFLRQALSFCIFSLFIIHCLFSPHLIFSHSHLLHFSPSLCLSSRPLALSPIRSIAGFNIAAHVTADFHCSFLIVHCSLFTLLHTLSFCHKR